jgi:hypothetical protein
MFIRTHTQVEFSLPYHFLSNFFSLCRQQKVGSTKHKTKKNKKRKRVYTTERTRIEMKRAQLKSEREFFPVVYRFGNNYSFILLRIGNQRNKTSD